MVGDEGPCRGAAGDRLHHRRLHFQESLLDQKGAHTADDAAAGDEDLMDGRVGDEVHVPLAVTRLDVRQPVPLLRQGAERLAQEGQLPCVDGEFIRLGAEQEAADADPVAYIKGHADPIRMLAQRVLL